MGRINAHRFIGACKGSGGLVSAIARRLSCSRQAVYDFLERYPEMKRYQEEAENELIELAESKIAKSIRLVQPTGSMEDVKWFLARKARKKGYGDRSNVHEDKSKETFDYKITIVNPNGTEKIIRNGLEASDSNTQ